MSAEKYAHVTSTNRYNRTTDMLDVSDKRICPCDVGDDRIWSCDVGDNYISPDVDDERKGSSYVDNERICTFNVKK